jgi:hypothetical protein
MRLLFLFWYGLSGPPFRLWRNARAALRVACPEIHISALGRTPFDARPHTVRPVQIPLSPGDNPRMAIATKALFLFCTVALSASASIFVGACSASGRDNSFTGGEGGDTGGSKSTTNGVGGLSFDGGGTGGGFVGDPKTCEEAALSKSYIGCDFYPTVVANNVWSVFDYAVVVANAGDDPADVTVMRGGSMVATDQIAPNELKKFYLPWVTELKGPDANACGSAAPLDATVRVADGAYHLTTSRPVTVYQFNALEYAAAGGPPGKNWSSCPAQDCGLECFSYSNDASLLLPTTALTGNYRITAQAGWPEANIGAYFAVTGTKDGTTVTVKLSATGDIVGGGGVPSTQANGLVSFNINEGEVVEVVGSPYADLGGTLVAATAPVQVITGMPCVQSPIGTPACDHIEESVFPAETLGRHYFVTVPTGPNGDAVGHVVRLYGNVDGTTLTYAGGKPPTAPTTLNAGQVVNLGQVNSDFEITGDHEFAVGSFMLGAALVDPFAQAPDQRGDPAQTQSTAVEQFRSKYIFLAPDDYDFSYVDVIKPLDAGVMIDGVAIAAATTPISNNYGIARVKLGPGNKGAHVLTATAPVGIQVFGYGAYTSYHYPGGLDLKAIAPPPPPPK